MLKLFLILILSIVFFVNYRNGEEADDNTKAMGKRSTSKLIHAVEQAEGAGARVRRSVGTMNNRKFNPFLLLDHFSVSSDAGFPQHGHSGQETITLVLKGAMAHEDFTGSKGILYPGDLQFMTAGKGVVHSEMPVQLEDSSEKTMTEGIQLWVDLPKALRETKPRYRDLRSWEIPEVSTADGKVNVKVISGKSYGVESAKDLAYTPVQYYYVTIQPNGTYTQKVPTDYNFFLYVLNGQKAVVNDDTYVPKHHTLFFEEDGDEVEVTNQGSDEIELVLVGGEVLKQESVQYGPFVADSEAHIKKKFMDYQYAKNGFEQVRTWESLISAGVTADMVDELGGNLEERKETERKHLEEKAKRSEGSVRDEL
ncbi:hypothetical protein CLIB1423_10S04192 [[Candida] railenensis]|uniref:Pirin n=1 Tax=[Candida] railenensis TaxID=45579 RepID=A0A9P0QR57_9ASCO|nr:hypothetical protein CLIB1423_10S04192 [[Candida] railenensis]